MPDLTTLNAYHEAGHVVIGHLAGMRLHYVTIVPQAPDMERGQWSLAHVEWDFPTPLPDTPANWPAIRERLKTVASICLGGVAASRIHTGVSTSLGAAEDLQRAAERARVLLQEHANEPTDEDVSAYVDELLEETSQALQSAWPAVRALAIALLNEQRVEGERARELIDATLAATRRGSLAAALRPPC